MIHYKSGGVHHFSTIFQINGSVFPRSLCLAVPCALWSALLRVLTSEGYIPYFKDKDSILSDNAAWGGFSFLVGFLIVFRTSQAYSRFWDGCTAGYRMRAEWFDACSSLTAFCKYSRAKREDIRHFKGVVVRLFSMLHAAALAEIEDPSGEGNEGLRAFEFELLDGSGIDETSLHSILQSRYKVELIFQWIQELVVENINNNVLSIPAPLLSRSFQELANGMVAFHEASKIAHIPFPFPYAQTCDLLLFMHWLIVPCVVCQWVKTPWWAAVFSFIQVFVLWALNFIAAEIENPYGTDANDLDGSHMQFTMNRHMSMLLAPETENTPTLGEGVSWRPPEPEWERVDDAPGHKSTFKSVWAKLQHSRSSTSSVGSCHGLQRCSSARNSQVSMKGSHSIRDHVASMQQRICLPQQGMWSRRESLVDTSGRCSVLPVDDPVVSSTLSLPVSEDSSCVSTEKSELQFSPSESLCLRISPLEHGLWSHEVSVGESTKAILVDRPNIAAACTDGFFENPDGQCGDKSFNNSANELIDDVQFSPSEPSCPPGEPLELICAWSPHVK